MTAAIIVAVLSLGGTLAGAYLANRKSAALIAYRLEQLEKKVAKHLAIEDAQPHQPLGGCLFHFTRSRSSMRWFATLSFSSNTAADSSRR